jgi:hypothetical protein
VRGTGEGSGWGISFTKQLRVQIGHDVVHLRTSLVQLFVLLQLSFKEVVQIIELKRFGGAPNGYPFAALRLGLQYVKPSNLAAIVDPMSDFLFSIFLFILQNYTTILKFIRFEHQTPWAMAVGV